MKCLNFNSLNDFFLTFFGFELKLGPYSKPKLDKHISYVSQRLNNRLPFANHWSHNA